MVQLTWHVSQPCNYFVFVFWVFFFYLLNYTLKAISPFRLHPPTLPSLFSSTCHANVKFLCSNCQPDHSLSSASPHLFRPLSSLTSPFNIPSAVNHFCFIVRLLWLRYMVSMVIMEVFVREHDQLMKIEPGVMLFPRTDGVFTGLHH